MLPLFENITRNHGSNTRPKMIIVIFLAADSVGMLSNQPVKMNTSREGRSTTILQIRVRQSKCDTWSGSELVELSNRRESLLLKGIKDRLIDNSH
jgi:hypothetical protein